LPSVGAVITPTKSKIKIINKTMAHSYCCG